MAETKKLKFLVNTTYNRINYGPGFSLKTAEVDKFWADRFIDKGRAEEVKPKKPKAKKAKE